MTFQTVEDLFDFLEILEDKGVITLGDEDVLLDELEAAFTGEGDYDQYSEIDEEN